MKKIPMLICTLLMLFALSACSEKETQPSYSIAPSGSWTDGSYTQTAEGYAGAFDVTITIKDGKLAEIDTQNTNETPEYGGTALAQLSEEMIQAQTYDVDIISGATETSNGLRNAVARALEEASSE